MLFKNLLRAGALVGALLFGGQAAAQSFTGTIAAGQFYGNPGAGVAKPQGASVSAMFDRALGATANGFPARISGTWQTVIFSSSFAFSGTTLNLNASGASTLGGVNSFTCTANQWMNTLSTAGAFSCAQPAFSNISGQATFAQLPNVAADNVIGNPTGSTAAPTNVSIGNCAQALTYSTGTHTFGCNASGGPPPYSFINCALTASVTSNNLTINLTDNAGATPSAGSTCQVYFRNATQSTGSWTQVLTTSVVSFTANAGSTFGATNTSATCRAAASCPFKLWVVGINSGAGLVLGVVDLTNASGVLAFNEGTLLTTTACSACATATTLGTVYSTAAQTSKPFVILGYLEWGSGLGTAGTYASAPTSIQTLGPGIRKPGEIVQSSSCCIGSVTTVSVSGTTFAAGTNTNITANITPSMASNLIKTGWAVSALPSTTATDRCQMSDTSGPTAVGGIGAATVPAGAGGTTTIQLVAGGYDTPSVTTVKTYTLRCWASSGSVTVPDVNTDGAMEFIEEIMG